MFEMRRVKKMNDVVYTGGAVLYHMSRDQRVRDNWALVYASQLAEKSNSELYVVFSVYDEYCDGAQRSYDFMFDGLKQVQNELAKLNIPMIVLHTKDTAKSLADLCKEVNAGMLVLDMTPIRDSNLWESKFLKENNIAVHKVDAYNIIPVWITSDKQEFAARTIRPKIHKQIGEFLTDFPEIETSKSNNKYFVEECINNTNWDIIKRDVKGIKKINTFSVDWKSGEDAAAKQLENFLDNKVVNYDEARNDAAIDGQSNMSPYIMFGQISRQRIVLEYLKKRKRKIADAINDAYLEELIVRAELSENYCYYNSNYDKFEGLAKWAQETLNKARVDKREYIYTLKEFEEAKTHDDLWNAAQLEMVTTGKMHGYMRMYWAKKILEWSESPEDAIKIAIYLNNVYELDGRCPNAYVGVLWSIGGLHDRAWFPRPVFGNIRYMARSGCEKKFDVKAYINKNLYPKLL
jgi:deoxyribodipyrimidine photo-lyase